MTLTMAVSGFGLLFPLCRRNRLNTPPTFQIVRAKPENAAALTKIAFAAKRHWGYPERWIQKWSAILTISPALIHQHETYAAIAEDSIVGFFALCFQDQNRLRLEHLWVIPQAMGIGIGRSLFLHAVQVARELGFELLEVESDPHVEGFYLRMGAVRVGTKASEVEGQWRELPILQYTIAQ